LGCTPCAHFGFTSAKQKQCLAKKHFCILGRRPASKNPVNIFQNAFVMRRITVSEYFFSKR